MTERQEPVLWNRLYTWFGLKKEEIGTLKDLVCSGLSARSRMPMPKQSNFVNVGDHGAAHKRCGAARLAESVTRALAKDTAGLELAGATKGVATARVEALVPKARCEAGHHIETRRTRASQTTAKDAVSTERAR